MLLQQHNKNMTFIYEWIKLCIPIRIIKDGNYILSRALAECVE